MSIATDSSRRIEPARLDSLPEAVSNVVAELAAEAARLAHALNPQTAASLASLVRIMNSYYSNLIEGHDTQPRDIERALTGSLSRDAGRRELQREAAAHVRVQAEIDRMAAEGRLPEPSSLEFIQWLHREFYRNAPPALLRVRSNGREFLMEPGAWRSHPDHDVVVGRHQPPSSRQVESAMTYFAERYRFDRLGTAARIAAIPAAHHRLNYIHPFPDGNGRVSRLMSHAMTHAAGIGAHGLWSVARGLARGLESRGEYLRMMDEADSPRRSDLDGRGNLSHQALEQFIAWFLRICLDQLRFMSGMFELNRLSERFRHLVERSKALRPEAALVLEEALLRGSLERGDVPRITGLPERSARRVLNQIVDSGLLASDTPKGPVTLRFPTDSVDLLFPRLFPET